MSLRHFLLLIVVTGLVFLSGCFGKPSPERAIREGLEKEFAQTKQQIFGKLHPMGTAKSVEIHDIVIEWRRGKPSKKMADVKSFTVTYTLFWESLRIDNGYTKVRSTYDVDARKYVDTKILATNGITNSDVKKELLDMGAALLIYSLF